MYDKLKSLHGSLKVTFHSKWIISPNNKKLKRHGKVS